MTIDPAELEIDDSPITAAQAAVVADGDVAWPVAAP